jgi:hypothetical protein
MAFVIAIEQSRSSASKKDQAFRRSLLRRLALDIQVPPRALRDDGAVHVVIALQRSHRVGKRPLARRT